MPTFDDHQKMKFNRTHAFLVGLNLALVCVAFAELPINQIGKFHDTTLQTFKGYGFVNVTADAPLNPSPIKEKAARGTWLNDANGNMLTINSVDGKVYEVSGSFSSPGSLYSPSAVSKVVSALNLKRKENDGSYAIYESKLYYLRVSKGSFLLKYLFKQGNG